MSKSWQSSKVRPMGLAYSVLVLLALVAVQGTSAQTPPPIPNAPLSPVIVHAGQSFITAADWQPFEVRGVNYIRPSSSDPILCPEIHFGMHEHCPWDTQAIAADMDRLQALGVNTVRVFLNFYAFGGTTLLNDATYSIEPSLQHLEEFITIANSRNIYVLPVLMAKYPQKTHFEAEMLPMVVKYHVEPIVKRFANHPGILAWDLFNEPDIAGPVDVRCWDWDNRDYALCYGIVVKRMLFLNMLRDEVKRLDLYKPLTISVAFAKSYFRPQGAYAVPLADLVDFYAVHYYDNDPYDAGRYAQHWYYGEGFPRDFERSIDELHALQLGKPVVFTEVGFPSGEGTMRTWDEAQRDIQAVLRISREQQAGGIILWPFQATHEQVMGDVFR